MLFYNLKFSVMALGLLGAPETPGQVSSQSLTTTVFASQKLNDDFSLLSAIPKPVISYRLSRSGYDWHILSAVLLHRAELRAPLTESSKWLIGVDSFFWKSGDEPNLDGQSFDQYAFSAHRWGGFVGAMTRFGETPTRFDLSLRYEIHNLYPYDKAVATDFAPPSSFWEHGVIASLDPAGRPPSELMTFGIRPSVTAGAFYRQGNNSWGVGGFQRSIDSYVAASASVLNALPVSDRFVAVFDTHLSWVSKADRLNGIKGGVWRKEFIGLLTGDLRLDRAWASDVGVRYYLTANKDLAVRPFGHMLVYREIRLDRLRNDMAGGGGLKLMGSSKNRLFWNLTYGFIAGDRTDKDAIHEVKADVSFKFL